MIQIIGTKISRSRWKVVNIITNVGVIKTINLERGIVMNDYQMKKLDKYLERLEPAIKKQADKFFEQGSGVKSTKNEETKIQETTEVQEDDTGVNNV